MSNSITFTCWNGDEPLDIQLEPEAIRFRVLPGNELTFTGKLFSTENFKWALRIEHHSKDIQLMPDVDELFEIEIFENGVRLDNWHNYM
ncbi:hypothetical protein IC235_10635 [Hymenobacter sp. BT664]|uniref:Uncharacterized protein n=1 Tax=Hymenobacter montanus TaxID=2771359 RepID=A0A927BDV2_9BACT|nr:hypothetical protein [Hymenobacter montanus]MBD2768349.1 hypothetical protein [Hymenobacter montanus]